MPGTFRPRATARARDLRRHAAPAERHVWRYLARGQLGVKFSRQMPIGPHFADFLCRERALVVELDGHSHDTRSDHDTARDAYLRRAGYRVLHFTNEQALRQTEGVLLEIKRALGLPLEW